MLERLHFVLEGCVGEGTQESVWGLNMILTITAECSMALTFTSAKESYRGMAFSYTGIR